jgi:hypothetical protein
LTRILVRAWWAFLLLCAMAAPLAFPHAQAGR